MLSGMVDNNLAINTAQGRVDTKAGPSKIPPHLYLQQPPPRETSGYLQLPLASALGRAGKVCSTLLGHTGQPLSCCPNVPGEDFLCPLAFSSRLWDSQIEGLGKSEGHNVTGRVTPHSSLEKPMSQGCCPRMGGNGCSWPNRYGTCPGLT